MYDCIHVLDMMHIYAINPLRTELFHPFRYPRPELIYENANNHTSWHMSVTIGRLAVVIHSRPTDLS